MGICSRTLLEFRSSTDNNVDGKDLIERLDGLPLAITTAGSYINQTGMDVYLNVEHAR